MTRSASVTPSPGWSSDRWFRRQVAHGRLNLDRHRGLDDLGPGGHRGSNPHDGRPLAASLKPVPRRRCRSFEGRAASRHDGLRRQRHHRAARAVRCAASIAAPSATHSATVPAASRFATCHRPALGHCSSGKSLAIAPETGLDPGSTTARQQRPTARTGAGSSSAKSILGKSRRLRHRRPTNGRCDYCKIANAVGPKAGVGAKMEN
jgi:hypothetical protein